MSFTRIIARALPAGVTAAAAVLVAGAARPASAQERVLFRWEGRVDREASLTMRDGRVTTPGGWLGAAAAGGDLRVSSALPEADGYVRLRVERGRGDVDVTTQPSRGNDYTAVVRVRDDQPGAGDYRLTAYWVPRSGSVARGGGWGSWGNGNDRGDRADRARDRADRRQERDREREGRRAERDDRRRDRDRDRNDDYDSGRNGNGQDRGGWGWGTGNGNGNGNGRYDTSSGALRWSGRVDDVQEIRVRGRSVDSYTVSGDRAYDVRSRVSGALPARDARVRVRTADGRGQVAVVQQPSARNDYTAVLRVVDRQPGADYYDIEATW